MWELQVTWITIKDNRLICAMIVIYQGRLVKCEVKGGERNVVFLSVIVMVNGRLREASYDNYISDVQCYLNVKRIFGDLLNLFL